VLLRSTDKYIHDLELDVCIKTKNNIIHF
jgi:hypothetical protein